MSALHDALESKNVEIAALKAELVAAKADTERIDWLEHNAYASNHNDSEDDQNVVNMKLTICQPIGVHRSPTTVRAAIDAARAKGTT